MSLLKIKRIPLYSKRISWDINFHETKIIPLLLVFVNTINMCISLASVEMQLASYATLAMTISSFLLMVLLCIRSKKVSTYGFLYFMFFAILIGLTIINMQDVKNCIYTAINVWAILLIFRYYRDKTHMIILFFGIALSFCIYINFIHLITHPSLWTNMFTKESTGYLLGNNYNQMGCRIMICLATNALCSQFSKIYLINYILLCIVSIASLSFVGSMTSLSMVVLYIVFYFTPFLRLRMLGIIIFFTIYILFQTFVVFSGKGLENNQLAVYIIEDILHKDITFTQRTQMWDSALHVISKSPIWGWGFVTLDWYKSFMSSFAAGPHNFILSIIVNGGILLLSIFILIAYKSYKVIKPYFRERMGQNLIFATLCLYFMALMEMYPMPIMFYLLTLMFYYPNSQKAKIQ